MISANVTALTHVKLVTINKKSYKQLNKTNNNIFEDIFAPHRDVSTGQIFVPKVGLRGKVSQSKALKSLSRRNGMDRHQSALNLMPNQQTW